MRYNSFKIPSSFSKIISDLSQRLEVDDDQSKRRVLERGRVYSWPRTWSSTDCGHDQIGGNAMTESQTFVIDFSSAALKYGAFIYQADRFSYHVEKPNNKFFEDMSKNKLIAERDYDGEYERE